MEKQLQALSQLRLFLEELLENNMEEVANSCLLENKWFTSDSISNSVKGILNYLDPESLDQWINKENITITQDPRKIGIIMAGNIPAVGFHDLLCSYITGNITKVKLSSQDQYLMHLIINKITEFNPDSPIEIVEKVNDIEAVIATGSNNSARYFSYYFSKYPHIIRKNRNSAALIYNSITDIELEHLSHDIFSYFGLGCRSVSKLYIEKGFDLPRLDVMTKPYSSIIHHNKYINNYEYQRSLLLINKVPHLDFGNLMIRENTDFATPVSVVNYEFFDNNEQLTSELKGKSELIQCIVGPEDNSISTVKYGKSQSPELWDYADNINTIEFIKSL